MVAGVAGWKGSWCGWWCGGKWWWRVVWLVVWVVGGGGVVGGGWWCGGGVVGGGWWCGGWCGSSSLDATFATASAEETAIQLQHTYCIFNNFKQFTQHMSLVARATGDGAGPRRAARAAPRRGRGRCARRALGKPSKPRQKCGQGWRAFAAALARLGTGFGLARDLAASSPLPHSPRISSVFMPRAWVSWKALPSAGGWASSRSAWPTPTFFSSSARSVITAHILDMVGVGPVLGQATELRLKALAVELLVDSPQRNQPGAWRHLAKQLAQACPAGWVFGHLGELRRVAPRAPAVARAVHVQ